VDGKAAVRYVSHWHEKFLFLQRTDQLTLTNWLKYEAKHSLLLFSWAGVRLNPLGTLATVWPFTGPG
jgi:hypothetical protein